jgi:hypothetical protein
VKGGEIVTAAATTGGGVTSFLPPRTVVLNSSLIKAISCAAATVTVTPTTGDDGTGVGTAGTTSLVRYPVPVLATTTSTAAVPAANICDKPSLAAGPTPSAHPSTPTTASQLLCPVSRSSIVPSSGLQPGLASSVLLLPPSRDQEVQDRLQPVSSPPSPGLPATSLSLAASFDPVVMATDTTNVPLTAPSLPSSPRSLSSSPSPGPGNHAADDTLVDAITDGSLDGRDDEEYSASRLPPALDLQMEDISEAQPSPLGPKSPQHNGDVSPPPAKLTTVSEAPAGSVDVAGKRKVSAASWRTNGKKSTNDTGIVDQDASGSLLRPLLATGGGLNDVEESTLSADLAQQQPATAPLVAAKRSRRDTGSSVQSDRSDLSGPTGEQMPPLKRARPDEATKAGTNRSSATGGLKENNTAARKEHQTLKGTKVNDNG